MSVIESQTAIPPMWGALCKLFKSYFVNGMSIQEIECLDYSDWETKMGWKKDCKKCAVVCVPVNM